MVMVGSKEAAGMLDYDSETSSVMSEFHCWHNGDKLQHHTANQNNDLDQMKKYFIYTELPRIKTNAIATSSCVVGNLIRFRFLLRQPEDESQALRMRRRVKNYKPPVVNFAVIHRPFITDKDAEGPIPKNGSTSPMIRSGVNEDDDDDDDEADDDAAPGKAARDGRSNSPKVEFGNKQGKASPQDRSDDEIGAPVLTSTPRSDASRPVTFADDDDDRQSGGQSSPKTQTLSFTTQSLQRGSEDNSSRFLSSDTEGEEEEDRRSDEPTLPARQQVVSDSASGSFLHSTGAPAESMPSDERWLQQNEQLRKQQQQQQQLQQGVDKTGDASDRKRRRRIRPKKYFLYCEIPVVHVNDHRVASITSSDTIHTHFLLKQPENEAQRLQLRPIKKYRRPRVNFAVIHRSLLVDDVAEGPIPKSPSMRSPMISEDRPDDEDDDDEENAVEDGARTRRANFEEVEEDHEEEQQVSDALALSRNANNMRAFIGFTFASIGYSNRPRSVFSSHWRLYSMPDGNQLPELTISKE